MERVGKGRERGKGWEKRKLSRLAKVRSTRASRLHSIFFSMKRLTGEGEEEGEVNKNNIFSGN